MIGSMPPKPPRTLSASHVGAEAVAIAAAFGDAHPGHDGHLDGAALLQRLARCWPVAMGARSVASAGEGRGAAASGVIERRPRTTGEKCEAEADRIALWIALARYRPAEIAPPLINRVGRELRREFRSNNVTAVAKSSVR